MKRFRARLTCPQMWALPLIVATLGQANSSAPLRVGTIRQLFVDEFLIAGRQNVDLKLNNPVTREVVLRADKPWEGQTMTYPSVFKDGDKFRLYYRASGPPLGAPPKREEGDKRQMVWNYTALAESADGIQWNKPNLGVVDFQGNKQNNLIWPVAGQPGSDIFPFKDANPQASADERYKFIKMAWDLLGSEFAGRHTQYEKFYGGPPHIMDLYSFFNCPWGERRAAVDQIIKDKDALHGRSG